MTIKMTSATVGITGPYPSTPESRAELLARAPKPIHITPADWSRAIAAYNASKVGVPK